MFSGKKLGKDLLEECLHSNETTKKSYEKIENFLLKTKNNKLWDLTKLNKCMQKFPVCAFKNFHINSFQKGLLTPNNVRPINPKC